MSVRNNELDAADKGRIKLAKENKKTNIKWNVLHLFKYSTPLDITLLLIGTLCIILAGPSYVVPFFFTGVVTNIFINETAVYPTSNKSGNIALHYDVDVNNFSRVTPNPESVSSATQVRTDDHVQMAADFQRGMNECVLAAAIAGAVILLSTFTQLVCWQVSSERRIKRLRMLFFSRVIRRDISWFDTNETGTLATRLSDDLEKLRSGTGIAFSMAMQTVSQFCTCLGICFYLSALITLVSSIFVLVVIGLILYSGKLAAETAITEQEQYAAAGAVAEETLSNVRTVMAFNGQSRETGRYEKALKQGYVLSMTKYNAVAWCTGIQLTLTTLMSVLVFWYWSAFMQDQGVDPGTVMTLFLLLPGVPYLIILVQPCVDEIGGCFGIAAVIHKMISQIPDIDSDSKVLKGLNLIAEPGQKIAIVGPSGAGKSTIVSLLLRFYDTLQGQILIDDIPIAEYNLKWLRSQIGLVSQEPVLFGVSIADNIALGRESASTEEIVEAAQKANAHDFIVGFPKGYDTLVGDTGTQLSGGQKQRIAIARALIRNPSILLLDEATSALDSVSESAIQEALENATAGRTTIVIAHRLSTIRNADLIYVMKDGKIQERGNHNELMIEGSLYRTLVIQQFGHENLQEAGECETNSTICKNVRRTNDQIKNRTSSIDDGVNRKQGETKGNSADVEGFLVGTNETCQDAGKTNDPSIQSEETAEISSLPKLLTRQKLEWKWLLMGLVGCVGVGLRWIAVSIFAGQLISVFELTGSALQEAARIFTLSFVAMALISAVFSYMQDKGMAEVSKKLILRVRVLVFENILRQPVGWFDQETSSPGVLINRLARTAPLIEAAGGVRLGRVTSVIVTTLSGFSIAFFYNWKLTLIMFLCIMIMVGVAYMQQIMQMKRQLKDANHSDTAGRVALETLRNIRMVQALGQEALFTEIYMKHLELPYREAIKQTFYFSLFTAMAWSYPAFMFAIAFEVGGNLFARGETQLNDIYKTYFAMIFILPQLYLLLPYLQENTKARTAMKLLNRLLTRKSNVDGTDSIGLRTEIRGQVEFQDVRFSYPTRLDTEVLSGLCFTIEAGKTLALVGESGSGKSTVVSLLERYYDANSGKIQIDGYDIATLNLSHLRSNIGVVTQEPVLFNMTIRENIAYGALSSQGSTNFDDIQQAARIANAHDFIMALPDRYDTIIGERGVQLSGGQKQRLAIARALLRNPKILLMDEATSALDSENEKVVQAAVNNARKGRTCIIIAHRLSTIQDANKICVISNGRIVECGTHDELQKLEGHYYTLMQKQSS